MSWVLTFKRVSIPDLRLLFMPSLKIEPSRADEPYLLRSSQSLAWLVEIDKAARNLEN